MSSVGDIKHVAQAMPQIDKAQLELQQRPDSVLSQLALKRMEESKHDMAKVLELKKKDAVSGIKEANKRQERQKRDGSHGGGGEEEEEGRTGEEEGKGLIDIIV